MPITERIIKSTPTALVLIGIVVMCAAWWAEFWPLEWVGGYLVFSGLLWRHHQGQWTERRMQLRPRIPESTRLESLKLPRCNVILESAGGHGRRVAKALRRLFIMAPWDASELCGSAPVLLKPSAWRAEAELVKARLEDAGAVVRIEPCSEPGA